MKTVIAILMAGIFLVSCNSQKSQYSKGKMETKTLVSQEEMVVNTALFYLKDGQEETFAKLRSRGGALLEKYGAHIERVIKPKMIAQGDIELPDEIHFAVYPNKEALAAFNSDPEFLKLKQAVVGPSVEKMYAFSSKLSDFEFTREIGDKTKNYGVALVYFKEGAQYEQQFAEYHDDACEIIPEFGAHFERFLVPMNAKGDLAMPDEIHRFYFDSPEGMQQMGSDPRMQELFPKRDAALSNLIFFVGEALQ